jgi:peptide/nickel transport system permease protein
MAIGVWTAPGDLEGDRFADSQAAGGLRQLWAILRANRSSLVGLGVLIVLTCTALLAPIVAPYNPNTIVGPAFAPPSASHLLGLDDGGHDVLSLLIWGLRVSLYVGFGATAISVVLGAGIGLLAGYAGGFVDVLLMRFTDFILVIPTLPLMIVVADIWSPSLLHLVIVIGVISWTMTAIVVRAQTRTARQRTFVRRSAAFGASHRRIIGVHILPQVLPLIIANAVLLVGYAIFTETALAFLGLGDPTQVSLGTMIEFAFLRSATSVGAWWAIAPPGALVAVIVVATSLVGRAIEDGLNPRIASAHLAARTFRAQAGGRLRRPK